MQVARISKRTVLVNWLPVLLMLVVIAIESTLLSSSETGSILFPILNWLTHVFGGSGLSWQMFEMIHHILRKAGHLTGYAMLCGLSFRAFRGTARSQLSRVESGWSWFWQSKWLVYALIITVLVASADEIHQSMDSSRTGSFRDVLIDTSGGLLALLLIYLVARRTMLRKSQELS